MYISVAKCINLEVVKISENKLFDLVKEKLAKLPYGASLEEIKKGLGFHIELRTLQRRLKKLTEEGEIYTSGGSRATKYHLAFETNLVRESELEKLILSKKEGIYISPAGQKIMDAVSKPIRERTRVGYNRDFLESYRPNKDQFLTKDDLIKLTALGKTNTPNQPAGTHAKEILNRLLIDLSWNSSRLEGNTYSLLDTKRLVEFGESADEKSVEESQMIINHKDAIEFLVQLGDEIEFNSYVILNLHALLSDNLLQNQYSIGRLRSIPVGIHESTYTPLAIPQLISDQFDLILKKTREIKNPFEQAFFILVHLPYLQPFDDVNKRTSRLAANIPFVKNNLSPLSFVEMPSDLYIKGILGIYELNQVDLLKDVFIWGYERSAVRYAAIRQTVGEPDPFRTKYRNEIRDLITDIISNNLSPKKGSQKIKSRSMDFPVDERSRFVEYVEAELIAIHEGSFARFRVTPSEFRVWKDHWSR
ncbi:hypothetical protein P872_23655 [Rhodonellum psychrophilum GCM71 = DSM 17998]|uniref:Fido domain-containing protein n=2 Tax=Rhodonellum TaxID=336827 RepID=U5C4G3_9BACT|nr:hypothetical protein P872_23655 [Rhodonellum psychrophilum GCM71 = DSM 17998]SDZ12897.1 Fic/DOC family protein [Rhodonellum ikkaensis]